MPQNSSNPELAVVMKETGAAYRLARTTILSSDQGKLAAAIDQLRSSDAWQSRLMADILDGWVRQPKAFDACLNALKNDPPGPKPITGYTAPVRGQAIAALGPQVVPRILELLWKTRDEVTSSEAAALLVALTILKDSRSLPILREIREQPLDPSWQRGAVLVLMTLGNEALGDVLRAASLEEADISVRTVALQGLHQFSDPRAQAALLTALRDGSRSAAERRAAATSLYKLGDPETLRAVSEWLEKETDEEVQLTLVALIGNAGRDTHIPALERLSLRGTDSVRQVVRNAIAEIRRREQL